MSIWTFVILAIYFAGFGVIHHAVLLASLQQKLERSSSYVASLSRRNTDLERHVEAVNSEIHQLIERDVKSFSPFTSSLTFDVEVTPEMHTDCVRVMAQIPALYCQFSRRDVVHKDSLKMMAKDVSQRLEYASYNKLLTFFSNDLKIGTIL